MTRVTIQKVMPTLPVSELRTHQAQVLARLQEGPVLLTQRGRGAGVLVHPDRWNELVEALLEYEDITIAQERMLEARENPDAIQPLSKLRENLQRDGLLSP